MPIKTIVNRPGYSKLFFLPVLFCVLLPQIMKVHNHLFYALETPLVVLALPVSLFRLPDAPCTLQRGENPGLIHFKTKYGQQ
jgi:hypothetical protein